MRNCLGCRRSLESELSRDPQIKTCKACRQHPRIYYYERLIRNTLGLPSRASGGQSKFSRTAVPDSMQDVFNTVKVLLPYHIYWDTSVDLVKMSRQELIAFYDSLKAYSHEPYKLVRWYACAHDHPPTPVQE